VVKATHRDNPVTYTLTQRNDSSRHSILSGLLGKLIAGIATLALLPGTAAAVTLSSFASVYYPGSTLTLIKGMNDQGLVVGEYWDTSVQKFHGFYYDSISNTYYTADRTGGQWTEAWGINDSGTIVAGGPESGGHYSGFYTTTALSTFTTIDVSGSNLSELLGINNNNVVVGGYGLNGYHPFIFDLNTDPTNLANFTMLGVPGAQATTAFDINIYNQVAGNYYDGSTQHGFFFDGSTYTSISYPGATYTEALGLNDYGKVVGYYIGAGGIYHGYMYDVLTGLYTTIDIAGSTGTRIFDINNNGQISGGYFINTTNYSNPGSNNHLGFISAIPLPPALLLFGSGILGLLGFTSRRNSQAS
jgi:hypothetical protein